MIQKVFLFVRSLRLKNLHLTSFNMNVQALEAITDRALKQHEIRLESCGMGNHYFHVAGNITFFMSGKLILVQSGIPWSDVREEYTARLTALRRYFRLLDDFEDFRDTETSAEMTPFFPEGPTDSVDYVNYAYERLKPK